MFKKIVVALDGSLMSTKGLEAALSFGKLEKTDIILLHVVKELHPQYATGEIALSVSESNAALRSTGEQILSSAQETLNKNQLSSTTALLSGEPAERILHYAKQEQADLIIMGCRGLGTIKEWILGSVSHKVVQSAQCPVFILK